MEEIEFEYERETKNKYRFQEAESEDGMPPKIGALYVSKWVFSGDKPEKVWVTIETEDGE